MRIDGVGDVVASLAVDPKAGSIGGRLSVVKTELTGLREGGGARRGREREREREREGEEINLQIEYIMTCT